MGLRSESAAFGEAANVESKFDQSMGELALFMKAGGESLDGGVSTEETSEPDDAAVAAAAVDIRICCGLVAGGDQPDDEVEDGRLPLMSQSMAGDAAKSWGISFASRVWLTRADKSAERLKGLVARPGERGTLLCAVGFEGM